MARSQAAETLLDQLADQVVAYANEVLDQNPDADAWEVASGLLAGVVHFWLYTRQPCADLTCRSCAEVSTPQLRLEALLEEVRQSAHESDYYETAYDRHAGRA
jgi:hypothetical protein